MTTCSKQVTKDSAHSLIRLHIVVLQSQPTLVPKLHAVRSRNVICKLQVRPYTLRRGDTLSSIAEKRGECSFRLDGARSTFKDQ